MSEWQVPAADAVEFFPRRTRYCVLVPVINEGERIRRQLERMAAIAPAIDIMIVDGGSSDGSLDLDRLRAGGVRALYTKTGPGRLSAQMRVGLAAAMRDGYEGVVLIDGNDKDDPRDAERFIEALDAGFDHVQGSRFIRGGRAVRNPRSRVAAVRLIHAPLISLAAGYRYSDTTNGFRAYSRRFLLDSRVSPFRDVFSDYELHYYLAIRAGQLGFRITEVPVERTYPATGPIPSKIASVSGKVRILRELFAACLARYDPREERG